MKKTKQIKSQELNLILTAILAIAFLELVALIQGVDGTMFGTATAGIGGVAGYLIKGFFKKK